MRAAPWYRVLCWLGMHRWCYAATPLDAVGRPVWRACLRCARREERRYNGYDTGAFGPWERMP